MENKEILELTTSAWREKVYIETAEYIIRGYVFMPKIGKKSRLLSDILNTNKQFIAVKNCSIESKLNPNKAIETFEFETDEFHEACRTLFCSFNDFTKVDDEWYVCISNDFPFRVRRYIDQTFTDCDELLKFLKN